MNSELKASLSADRTIDRVAMRPGVDSAYETLLNEVNSTRAELTPTEYALFLKEFSTAGASELGDLSIGYADAKFKVLDSDADGQLSNDELAMRKGEVTSAKRERSEIGIPKELEATFLDNLMERHDSLRFESRDDGFFTLYQEPRGITRKDLANAISRTDSMRKQFAPRPYLTKGFDRSPVADIPDSVQELLNLGGMELKSVSGSLKNKLKEHHSEQPNTAMAVGLYSATTNEIMTEKGTYEDKSRQHEIGHFIDDALSPGRAHFTESPAFVQALDKDMSALSTDTDWNKEFSRAHLFVRSGLYAGRMSESARKEIFADLYQTRDTELYCKMRSVFPASSTLIDKELQNQGIERFSLKNNAPLSTACGDTRALIL